MNGGFCRFWLVVTGKGEEEFLPELFRGLTARANCNFQVLRRIGQRDPVTSPERLVRMVRMGQVLPPKDVEEIGLPARRYMNGVGSHVIVIDDLESERAGQAQDVFLRYRSALDAALPEKDRSRASVHFFKNMLEAYFLADASATNSVLGIAIADWEGDVELIRNPKGELKKLFTGYHETGHGTEILKRLDVPHVLSNPSTCAALRTLFAWCWRSIGGPEENRFRFDDGEMWDVTRHQIGQG